MNQSHPCASRTRCLSSASLLLALLAAGCGDTAPQSAATSEPAGSTPAATSAPASTPVSATTEAIRLTRTPEWLIDVDGQPAADAVVYERQTPPYFLLTSSALPAPVLISVRAGSVETLDPSKLTVQADGTAELAPGAGQKSHGTFTSAADVRMTVEGKTVVLKQAPPLLGLQKASDLKAYSPNYEQGSRAYRPDRSALTALKGLKEPVVVQIYFGSWCPHCKQELPKVVRVDEELAGSQIRFEYYGLPHQFGNEPEAKRLKINAVPTGIVYMAGREVGRIEGSGWSTPEVALRNMLASPLG